jgi:poly-beta-hydroxybutyrate-responsive repressor
LTPVTLVLLKEQSSYGYELMERLEEEFGFEPINPGSVYRILRQMEKEELCESEWEPLEGGPARRMYFITDEGEAYLEAWADACKQYQQVMESFSRVYSSRTPRRYSEQ